MTWRTDDTEEALKAAYLAERDGTVRSRLQALWLSRAGRSLAEATAALGMHNRTVHRPGDDPALRCSYAPLG